MIEYLPWIIGGTIALVILVAIAVYRFRAFGRRDPLGLSGVRITSSEPEKTDGLRELYVRRCRSEAADEYELDLVLTWENGRRKRYTVEVSDIRVEPPKFQSYEVNAAQPSFAEVVPGEVSCEYSLRNKADEPLPRGAERGIEMAVALVKNQITNEMIEELQQAFVSDVFNAAQNAVNPAADPAKGEDERRETSS